MVVRNNGWFLFGKIPSFEMDDDGGYPALIFVQASQAGQFGPDVLQLHGVHLQAIHLHGIFHHTSMVLLGKLSRKPWVEGKAAGLSKNLHTKNRA